jgi:hypothetical protein
MKSIILTRLQICFTRRLVLVLTAVLCFLAPADLCADYYAAKNGQTPVGPYTSWVTAASSIQDAVNAAPTNGVVWVGAGRYTVPTNAVYYTSTNVVYIYKPLTLRSSNGVPASTIIDGEGKYRGICWSYATTTTNQFLLDGLAISNCVATNAGGGIVFPYPVSGSWTVTVQNCIISDNTALCTTSSAYAAGGGMYVYSVAGFGVTISNCVIRNNFATNSMTGTMSQAGGIYLYTYGNKLITGCIIEKNRSGAYGGGMYLLSAYNMMVENSVVRSNRCEHGDNNTSGGGMHLSSGIVTVRNCLICNNYGSYSGGGIYKFASVATPENYGLLTVLNCTIASNTASYGSALYVRRADRLSIANSIIYSNVVGVVSIYPHYFTNNWINQVEITNGVNGVGNITNGVDPRFINSAAQDYHFTDSSPCFNAGTNQDWMYNSSDLDGRKRIRYGSVDMGAYETLKDATIYRFK